MYSVPSVPDRLCSYVTYKSRVSRLPKVRAAALASSPAAGPRKPISSRPRRLAAAATGLPLPLRARRGRGGGGGGGGWGGRGGPAGRGRFVAASRLGRRQRGGRGPAAPRTASLRR